MIEPMLQANTAWLDATGPDSDIVLSTQCRLMRNLADFPFPKQCTPDERKSVEARILSAMTGLNFLSRGQYISLQNVDETEANILRERHLITSQLIHQIGARGVYIRDDQSHSISLNEVDHLSYISLASGQQLKEIWSSTSLADDTLAGILDFAFSPKRGYLTTNLADTGTGLRFCAILHLPGLNMTNALAPYIDANQTTTAGYRLASQFATNSIVASDFFRMSSVGTLGQSEMEMLYYFTQQIDKFVDMERNARKQLLDTQPLEIEDRIERALGLARNARLLAFDEGLGVLSSLRMGLSAGLLKGFSMSTLNEIGIVSQDAHLQLGYREPCDPNYCTTLRANLFRERFAENT